jgi:hypothetical protein
MAGTTPLTKAQVENQIAATLNPPIRKLLDCLEAIERRLYGLPTVQARKSRTALDAITFALEHPMTKETR